MMKSTRLLGLRRVSGSQSSAAIETMLQGFLASYDFSQPRLVLSDGASNMQSACRALSTVTGWVRCYVHLFQLVAGEVVKAADRTCRRVRALLALLSRSVLENERWATHVGSSPRVPAKTRWLTWEPTLKYIAASQQKMLAWGSAERSKGEAAAVALRRLNPTEVANASTIASVLRELDESTRRMMRDDATAADVLTEFRRMDSVCAIEILEECDEAQGDTDDELELTDEDAPPDVEELTPDGLRTVVSAGFAKREKALDDLLGAVLFDTGHRDAELDRMRKRCRLSRQRGFEGTEEDLKDLVEEDVISAAVRKMVVWYKGPEPARTTSQRMSHPLAKWLGLPVSGPWSTYWAANHVTPEIFAAAMRALLAPVSSTANERVFSVLRDILGVRGGGAYSDETLHAVAVLRIGLRDDPRMPIVWETDGRSHGAVRKRPPPTTDAHEQQPSKSGRLVRGQQLLRPKLTPAPVAEGEVGPPPVVL